VRLLPRSLRARLVVLFTVGTTVVLLASLALLYAALDKQLRDAVDADLAGRSNDLTAAVRTGDISAVSDDLMAQLYSADGGVLASSASVATRRLLSTGQVGAVRSTGFASRSLPLGHLGQSVRVRLLTRRSPDDPPPESSVLPGAMVQRNSVQNRTAR